ncbi:MAG TPA: porin, partial [Hyphomicrobiales bacterium]
MLKYFYGIPAVFAAACLGLAANTAYAADLGGGCCGDLEERISELEATAARKGNRTVSLTVTGQVSRAIMIWDDGTDSDAYVVDNAINTSRFGLEGKALIRPGLTAGYVMQIDINDSLSSVVSQFDPPGPAPGGDEGFGDFPQIRINHVYIDSESLGRISIGQNYSFNDAVSVPFQVANTFNTDGGPYADGMQLTTGAGDFAGFSWGQLIGNGPRRND